MKVNKIAIFLNHKVSRLSLMMVNRYKHMLDHGCFCSISEIFNPQIFFCGILFILTLKTT